MPTLLASRPTLIWALLVLGTLVSFGTTDPGADSARLARVAILLIAFAKVLLVGREFMELRHAPPLLLWLFQGWVVLVCTALLVLFW